MEAISHTGDPLLSMRLHKACGDLVLLVEDAFSHCDERLFVTFTTQERLDPLTLSAEVARACLRANTELFGTHFRRRGVRLFTFMVREKNENQSWHMHALFAVPTGALMLKAFPCRKSVSDVILGNWIKLGPPGRRQAVGQDAREIYNFAGVARYMLKGVRREGDLENIDYPNTYFPRSH